MRPMMMLTLPSSGSTWLVDVILDTLPWAKAHQKSAEFFAPLTNLAMYDKLQPSFGSENPECQQRIAKAPTQEAVDEAVGWFKARGYTFAKEVFQITHAPLFRKHFNVFMLHRSAAETFPPKRLRVLAWYDAIATAFENEVGAKFSKKNLMARAIQAHEYCWNYVLRGYAEALSIPVLEYAVLTRGDESALRAELAKAFTPEDVELLVPAIIATRRPER